ncbi:tRNA (guanosine(46)-N7)-methyltransferase TrmB [Hydrogenophaga sp.]|uniref:tRNA (guanosine(46)-N7)-methyltransferase TrmB n=1 Tax=Hydrogenophaga sp. TaxID=1904254 RepID=UPI0027213B75|nr:tRNA (guanosine(46)-N7)-methyltransferase TrmB [Hydrogenophaga sp.]MDO8903718.1 tRNA (guanosine(46)-N7)-methyltransferase TrmB [Hydrogenophaga sp.]
MTEDTPLNAERSATDPPAKKPGPPPGTYMRVVKSYVLRAGRTTLAQARAYELYSPRFLLSYAPQTLDVDAAFGRHAPLIMEIGFGMGGATAHIARVRPEDNFLCCEVHEPGVGALLKLAGDEGLENIRILRHDAVEVLDHMLPENSLDGVHIFFPDPWHKSRHHKRRLIQAPFVNRLARHLKPGGYLHLATDWQPYAEQMLSVLSAEPLLANAAQPGGDGYVPKPDYRPLTKFENRGLKLGHGVWDLVFRRL